MVFRRALCGTALLLGGCFNPDGQGVDTDEGTSTGSSETEPGGPTTVGPTSDGTTWSTTDDPTMSGSTTRDPDSTSTGVDPETGSSTGGIVQEACALEVLDGALGSPVATGDSNFGRSNRAGSCGGIASNELIFLVDRALRGLLHHRHRGVGLRHGALRARRDL